MEAVIRYEEEEQIAGSRRQSIEELYRLHAPEARRLAYLLTGSKELADDVTQDAFIRVMGRLGHLRDPESFGPYLRRTVVNFARMHFRRRKVEARYLETQMSRGPQSHDDPALVELDALKRSLLDLPYRQRAAIALRFYSDLNDEEISDLLGCAVGTVRSLVSRGLASLRAEERGDHGG